MKMPWPTSSGSSPAGSASSSVLRRRTLRDQLLEGLAVAQLVHVVEDRGLEVECRADRRRGFPRPPHRAADQAGDPLPGKPQGGGSRLLAAALGQQVAIRGRQRLLAGVGVMGRLAVAEEEDLAHSAAGTPPATTLRSNVAADPARVVEADLTGSREGKIS